MSFAEPGLRGLSPRSVLISAAGFGVALLAGYGSFAHQRDATFVALIPAIVILLRFPTAIAVLAVALIPFTRELPGGVAATDLLIVGASLSMVPLVLSRTSLLGPLKPMAASLVAYGACLVLVFAAHPSKLDLTGSAQRIELVLLALLIGAVAIPPERRSLALGAFVVASSVLSLAFIRHLGHVDGALGTNKNPAGGFMASAALILLGQRQLRKLAYVCGPLLAAGLIAAQSRGAIIGLFAGLIVLILFSSRSRKVLVAQVAVLSIAFLAAYAALPSDNQARITNLSGSTTRTAFAVQARTLYRQNAVTLTEEHFLTGVGLDDYQAVTYARFGSTSTIDDPHSVFYEEAAEGGVLTLAAFVFLIGSGGVAVLRRERTPTAVTALAVQVGILVHGCVDVYWVRDTPTLGWVLLGMALAEYHRQRQNHAPTTGIAMPTTPAASRRRLAAATAGA